ncbi:MAG: BON domain-containing protein [Rhodospirillaceae bacterium]|nr:BON domain-containing protein [Rhodospirillaceae bacterium]
MSYRIRRRHLPATPLALVIAFVVALLSAACDPFTLAVGAGAATGVASVQERGIKTVATDTRTAAQILGRWLDHDKMIPTRIGVEVYEGRALLTGIAASDLERANAVRLAWQVEGVSDVLNEIILGPPASLSEIARDSAITTELKSGLTFDKHVLAVNYSIETVRGAVYLIGIAQSREELDRVIARSRNTAYVRHVINHVRIKDEKAP